MAAVPLLIGSTGFIGKVMLERLLSLPKVKQVFVLIRSKKGKSFEERFSDMSHSPCFDSCKSDFVNGKVVLIEGDICQVNMGLNDDDYRRITAEVTHFINLADSVSFDLPILDATKINIKGSLNVLEVARDTKHLAKFVHCSTAYVSACLNNNKTSTVFVPEALTSTFATDGKAETVYNDIFQKGEHVTKMEEDKMIKSAGFPNTYVFTKCLAETLIVKKCKESNIPLAIVRPSVVGASLKYPSPGWVDSINAIAGVAFLYGGGFLHTPVGDPNVKLDVVPCDYAVDRLLHAAFEHHGQALIVIHATSGMNHSLTVGEGWHYFEDFWKEFNRKPTFLKPFFRSRSLDMEKSIELDINRLNTRSNFLSMIQLKSLAKTIHQAASSLRKVSAYSYFLHNQFDFQSNYSIKKFDANFDVDDYYHLFMQGVHYHCLNRGKTSQDNPKPVYQYRKGSSPTCTTPEFSFQDLFFSVRSKGSSTTKKTIIQNVSHKIESGQLVAVIGPSGSGKTTLMNILALKAYYGKLSGMVMLNGAPFDRAKFEKHCFHVEQYDKNWDHLTVNEVLTFAAKLFASISKDEIVREVTDVMRSIGLKNINTERCSNLSGGQQRRLSLAIALLKKPSILMLDEPTSGLDSAASNRICEILKNVTTSRKLIVICTIHQPSTKAFNNFNQMMILSKGRLAYAGSTLDAEGYFARLGHHLPPHTNPPEYYIDLVDSDFGQPQVTEELLGAWSMNGSLTDLHSFSSDIVKRSPRRELLQEKEKEKIAYHSSSGNFRAIFHRHFLLIWRDPILYSGRCIAFFVTNCIFAFVYWNARQNTQDQLANKMWLLMWFMCSPTMMGAVAVSSIHSEMQTIQREIKNGMIKPIHYILAKIILTLPIIVIFALAALGIPMFVIQTFDPSSFVPTLVMWSLLIYLFESLAEMIAAWSSDAILGMLIYLSYWMLSFLFGGIFLMPGDIRWPLKFLYYVMPFQYYTRNIMYIVFRNSIFESCFPETNTSSSICINSANGFDVLEEFQKYFPVIENPDPWHDALKIVGMILVYKTLYLIGFIWKRTGRSFSVNKASTKTYHFSDSDEKESGEESSMILVPPV